MLQMLGHIFSNGDRNWAKWAKSSRNKLVASDCSQGAYLLSSDFSSASVDKTCQHMSAHVSQCPHARTDVMAKFAHSLRERSAWRGSEVIQKPTVHHKKGWRGRQLDGRVEKTSGSSKNAVAVSAPKVFLWIRHGHSEVGYISSTVLCKRGLLLRDSTS